jgi:hypothetical protein
VFWKRYETIFVSLQIISGDGKINVIMVIPTYEACFQIIPQIGALKKANPLWKKDVHDGERRGLANRGASAFCEKIDDESRKSRPQMMYFFKKLCFIGHLSQGRWSICFILNMGMTAKI